jgi:hypothetical protein
MDWLSRFPAAAHDAAAPLIRIYETAPSMECVLNLIRIACAHGAIDLGVALAREAGAPCAPLAALLTEAELHTLAGRPADAVDAARKAVLLAPDAGQAWCALAVALDGAGDEGAAVSAMIRAKNAGYAYTGGPYPLLMLWLQACGDFNPRIAEILKPCPLLGRASEHLDARTEAVIESLLDAHTRAFELNPPHLPWLPRPAPSEPARRLKILLLHSDPVSNSQNNSHDDNIDYFGASAMKLGHEFRVAAGSELVMMNRVGQKRTRAELAEGLRLLNAEIAEFKPDLVISDGNFAHDETTLRPADLADRAARGFRWVVAMSDLYEKDDGFDAFESWNDADCILHFNRRTILHIANRHAAKSFYWPVVPFEPSEFTPRPHEARDKNFTIVGYGARGREIFAAIVGGHLPAHIQIHDKSKDLALPMPKYRALLGQSRMVFSNGIISNNLRIVTARVFETIWSGALLFEESGSDADKFLVPFVHYVPFANAHQLVAFAQFFGKHEDRRRAIADRGKAHLDTHFAPGIFWGNLRAHLGI